MLLGINVFSLFLFLSVQSAYTKCVSTLFAALFWRPHDAYIIQRVSERDGRVRTSFFEYRSNQRFIVPHQPAPGPNSALPQQLTSLTVSFNGPNRDIDRFLFGLSLMMNESQSCSWLDNYSILFRSLSKRGYLKQNASPLGGLMFYWCSLLQT